MAEALDETNLLQTAQELVDSATEQGIALRLLGGLAIRLLCPNLPHRTRPAQDLDFASLSSTRRQLTEHLAELGYVADRNFNALYGNKQLYFQHSENGLAIDVMVDKVEMCHTLPFADRLTKLPYTLDPMDLLLSKLQIVELNEKDVHDCLRLLVTFPLADSDDPAVMDLRIFRDLMGDDWGWWRTVTFNLDKVAAFVGSGERPDLAGPQDADAALATLTQTAEDAPKSRRWRLRARVGERKRWYETPEETAHH
jgi:hypothetical protein